MKEVNGNSVEDLINVFKEVPFENKKPNVIIANTIKGKGVSFIENEVVWHHKVPDDDQYTKAIDELNKQKIQLEND